MPNTWVYLLVCALNNRAIFICWLFYAVRKCQTRVCSGPNRCVKEGGVEECCHEECIGGCSGTRANECMVTPFWVPNRSFTHIRFTSCFNFPNLFKACRRYSNDGKCVSACPTTHYYNVHTSSWEVNRGGKVALGHVCVSRCPGMSLLPVVMVKVFSSIK